MSLPDPHPRKRPDDEGKPQYYPEDEIQAESMGLKLRPDDLADLNPEKRPICSRCWRFAKLDMPTLVWRCPTCNLVVTDQLAKWV